jgi:hypothetical protein
MKKIIIALAVLFALSFAAGYMTMEVLGA